ncbi:GntR family transcriptional regulator [Photobacterium satsumensis]|uniref:GntR family transcriptional regulator n=1 Tax=Photobacterium satsumensis TaxID=2910239 RepID=UPI003D1468BF
MANNELDHSAGAKPLYAQLYDILVDKLHKGEFRLNETMPTEAEFQSLFGVSRITARRALAELATNGYVKRERGIGTLVIRNTKAPDIKISGVVKNCKSAYQERVNISLELITPPENIRRSLQLGDGQELYLLVRVLETSDGKPAQVNYVFMPKEVASPEIDDYKNGLYVFIESKGYSIDKYQERVSALLPNKLEQTLLNTDETTPLLVRERICFDSNNSPILLTIAKNISEDYEYIVDYS